jgi:TRAP transporter TAXI family solute receptor
LASTVSFMDRPRLLNRRTVLGMTASAAAAAVIPGCSRGRRDEPAPAGPAKLATGNPGGVYQIYGDGLAKLVTEATGVQMSTVGTEGSVANLRMLARGTADLGFSLADSALDAYEGQAAFKSGALRLWALARTYDNYVHVVVPISSRADKLENLENLVVSVGPKDSGTAVVANRLLDLAGVKVQVRNLELEDATERLANGGIDAMIWSGGLPTNPILALQKTVGFKLVDIGKQAAALAARRYGGYVLSSIPPSVYGLANAVPTLAVPNYLLARRGLSDSWAWWTLNSMFRRQADLEKVHPEAGSLDARSAIATMPIPLHPAAVRWYEANHI